MASISSMNTIEGACSSATRNSSRTSFGPSPKYFWINSEPTTRKNVAEVWLATAFAKSVFPVNMTHFRKCNKLLWSVIYTYTFR